MSCACSAHNVLMLITLISKANFFKQGKYHLGVPQFPGSCFKIKLVSVTVNENI